MDKVYIGYHELHDCVESICRRISFKVDVVAGFSRGGLLPGVIASHKLGVPFIPIPYSTRDHRHMGDMIAYTDAVKEGKSILLMDDINDTGDTFLSFMSLYPSESTSTAVVVERSTSKYMSDFSVIYINDDRWIVFPYEDVI